MSVEASLETLQRDPAFRDYNLKTKSGIRKYLTPAARITLLSFIILTLILFVVVFSVILLGRKGEQNLEACMCTACQKEWLGFRGKCYYFSEDTRNWTHSQKFCASMEASLVQIETQEELNFLKRYKGPSDHWIGLSRESSQDIWKWTDGTNHNNSFLIKGGGECAYLNDNGISSARTYTDRKWICNTYLQRCQVP